MDLIRTGKDSELTIDNLMGWLKTWQSTTLPNIIENDNYFRNKDKSVLPFAKKIVTIATAATIGMGVEIKEVQASEDNIVAPFTARQKNTLSKIKDLFRRQTIMARDSAIIKQASTFGVGFELNYMSDDQFPVPKTKELSPLNTFVVFDDTVEDNSLYGVYFNEYKKGKESYIEANVYDSEYKYTISLPSGKSLNKFDASPFLLSNGTNAIYCPFRIAATQTVPIGYSRAENLQEDFLSFIESIEPHNMGRMPITMHFNNEELQGDFEQVKPTIDARNKINELAMEDAETIAGNYLVFKAATLAGNTLEEKTRTIRKIGKTKVIELGDGEDVNILTKQETFSMISVYGKDLENKIFELSMVIDFNSEEFSGNVTGVALRLKLFPFKRLVGAKDFFIERTIKRRIKTYMHALTLLSDNYEEFDVGDLDITIPRQWEENILELAQVIATLGSLGIFSDEYLIEKMPDGEYEIELKRKENESIQKSKNAVSTVDSNNFSNELLAGFLRG